MGIYKNIPKKKVLKEKKKPAALIWDKKNPNWDKYDPKSEDLKNPKNKNKNQNGILYAWARRENVKKAREPGENREFFEQGWTA